MRGLAVALIDAYRRHLSPRKAACCPHACLVGGPSCSHYARDLIAARGVAAALPLILARLAECYDSALLIMDSHIHGVPGDGKTSACSYCLREARRFFCSSAF